MLNEFKSKSNLIWLGALALLLVLSLVDLAFLSSCSGIEQGAAKQEAVQQDAEGQGEKVTSTAESGSTDEDAEETGKQSKSAAADGIDYLVLVNKTHELDPDWENTVKLVETTNKRGSTVTVESTALTAFEELQKALDAEGVVIDLNSCYRSRAKQQELVDQFTQEYGSDYVEKYVAKAGHSEHETGLALDVIPIVNGVEMLTNDEMLAQKDLWKVVHATMPKYGFILRYLPNQESITGYEYEPWHLRYVGTPDAQKISDSGLTLEEYLGEA